MTTPVNEWDDSLDMPAPCQPIGCDNGYHVPGCFYEVVVVDREHCGYTLPHPAHDWVKLANDERPVDQDARCPGGAA